MAQTTNYSPWVTPEKYSELSGLTIAAVKCAVSEGRLPVMRRDGVRRGRTYINMRALEAYALEQAEAHQEWKSVM